MRRPGDARDAGYLSLAAAIIEVAAADYVATLRGLLAADSRAKRKHFIDRKWEDEEFFRGPWFALLCDLDPSTVLAGLERIAIEKETRAAHADLGQALDEYARWRAGQKRGGKT